MTPQPAQFLPVLYGPDLQEITLLPRQGQPVLMSLVNITAGLHLRRTHLYYLVMRNLEELEGGVFLVSVTLTKTRANHAPITGARMPANHVSVTDTRTPSKHPSISVMPCTFPRDAEIRRDPTNWQIMVTPETVIWMAARICASRMKNPDGRKQIIAFKNWALALNRAILSGNVLAQFRVPLRAHMSLRRLGQKGEHVRQLAAEAGVTCGQIWRRIRKAKIQAGLPLRKTRTDAGVRRPHRRPA